MFKVINIIDGDTIRVSPMWVFNNLQGDIVKVRGYSTPAEVDQPLITKRLRSLILNQEVELKNAGQFNVDSEALLCSVILKGTDIAKYFF